MFGQTEFMVDMTCEGCVNSVKNKLETVDGEDLISNAAGIASYRSCILQFIDDFLLIARLVGVKKVDVDLTNQVVRVLGNSPVKILAEALEQTGRKARLIGQGLPDGKL